MTEKKICPFSLSLNDDSGGVRHCIGERCMAWTVTEIMADTTYGYCRLIERG